MPPLPGVPTGAFGPPLLATIDPLTGADRLGKRQARAALADLLGLDISVGMVCKAERLAAEAVAVLVEEVAAAISWAPALGVNETGRREARKRAWLGTAVAGCMTLFRIARSRGGEALRRLVGAAIVPVITSDRFSTSKVVPARQVYWAHLRRDFRAMIDRAARGAGVGARPPRCSGLMFRWWRRLGTGATHRTTLRGYVGWLGG